MKVYLIMNLIGYRICCWFSYKFNQTEDGLTWDKIKLEMLIFIFW